MARRKRKRERLSFHVDAEAGSLNILRQLAAQFTPALTDRELVEGMRELADELERDLLAQAKAVG